MVETQGDAKRFFVAKILAEAERQGMSLSEAERQMLSWLESDPEFKAEPSLIEQISAEMSDEEFETKIGRLLDAAYRRDFTANPAQRDVYRQAYSVLKEEDGYLLLMVDKALRSHMARETLCSKCGAPRPNGASQCWCGYRFDARLAQRPPERVPMLMWIHMVVCVLAIPKALFSGPAVGTAVFYNTLLGWVAGLVVLYALMFKGRQWARWVAALWTFPAGCALLLWGPVERFVASRGVHN